MKFKCHPMFTDVHGTIGKFSAYVGRTAQTIRIKHKGINPNSTYQQAVRIALKYYSGLWATVALADQLAWKAQAKTITKVDKIGIKYHPTGHAHFVSVNCEKRNFGIAGDVTTVPGLGLGTDNGPLAAIFTVNLPSPTSILIDIPLVSAGDLMNLMATPMMSAGRFYWKGKSQPIHTFAAGAAQPGLECITFYSARFGAPITGKKVAFKNEYYNGNTVTGLGSPLMEVELSGKVK